jgi:nickel transport protein
MVKSMKKNALALACVACVAVSAVSLDAHGIWFAQRAGQLALIYGEGAEDGAIVPKLSGVRAVAAYDAAGAPLTTKLIPSDHLLVVDTQQKPAVVTAVLDNGIWTVTPDGGEVNKPKNEVTGAKSSGHYYKYAVHLLGTLQKPLAALPNQTLQITPVAAVIPRRSGDPLTLRALFEGKPLANAEVTVDFVNDPEGTPMRTGADGTVTIKVRNQGMNVISIVHETPVSNSVAFDKVQHRATLSFVLPPRAE